MERKNERYVILAAILVIILVAGSVFLLFGKNSGFLSGSNGKPGGTANSSVETTVSATTSANTTTLNLTTILANGAAGSGLSNSTNSTVLSTTINTTVTTTFTSTLNSTSTSGSTIRVGGGQCVFGCGGSTTIPFSATMTVSNATVSQKGVEFLNATWNWGSSPYAVNFTIENAMSGNVIANALYTGISGSSNSFTFQLPFTINSLGSANAIFKVTSGSTTASASNSISINLASVQYTYNGASTSDATSLSTNVLPATGLIYFCDGTGYIGTLGTSWTNDESSSIWTSIGHQSSSLCSFTQAGTDAMYLAGIGVANALTYSTHTGSATASSSYQFQYTVANTSDYSFILVDQVGAYNPVISVSPTSGTCNTVEDQTSSTGDQGYSAIAVCSGQSANTYTVTVSYSVSLGPDASGYTIYTVT